MELEQKHREALQAQAVEHAGKLKEALDVINAADTARVTLESKMGRQQKKDYKFTKQQVNVGCD
ncbi:hypothetical protein TRIUR3_11207 [Triticum urartu]|uniref:Uncharacterized protein n=1 Tax=Triticum urartu TaxID=4572 RepID=M7ZVM6_TRIUA|nr:hypothetical protein TRIUR3_11207 [Triticum urartu]